MSQIDSWLDAAMLQSQFARRVPAASNYSIECVDSIPSTNAKLLTDADHAHGRFLIARQQTAGVGRRGRNWQSPPSGNLYLSFCFHTARPLPDIALMPLALGVEIAQCIEVEMGIELAIKWPNDLYLEGRKCGGILLETKSLANDITGIVMGVGVNVANNPSETALGRPTACLQQASGATVILADAALAIMTAIAHVVERPENEVATRLQMQWPARDFLLNRHVSVTQGSGTTAVCSDGIARGIAPDGGLRLERGGKTATLYAGEVTLGHVNGT